MASRKHRAPEEITLALGPAVEEKNGSVDLGLRISSLVGRGVDFVRGKKPKQTQMLDVHSSRRRGDLGGASGRVLEMMRWVEIMQRGA